MGRYCIADSCVHCNAQCGFGQGVAGTGCRGGPRLASGRWDGDGGGPLASRCWPQVAQASGYEDKALASWGRTSAAQGEDEGARGWFVEGGMRTAEGRWRVGGCLKWPKPRAMKTKPWRAGREQVAAPRAKHVGGRDGRDQSVSRDRLDRCQAPAGAVGPGGAAQCGSGPVGLPVVGGGPAAAGKGLSEGPVCLRALPDRAGV